MAVDERIAALVPHAGRMCLLERIVRWDETSVTAATTSHRDPTHPLRGDRGLRAIHRCEYGAQAMALHGGLTARARGEQARPGLLVSLREVTLACDFVHDLVGELLVEARRLLASDDAWQYEFAVVHAGRRLAHGRATVSVAAPA
jgi:predicted hotdog family 3-hydroxylacyl-ACP dehydratase